MDKVNVFSNMTEKSEVIREVLKKKLKFYGYQACDKFDEEAILTICIGGDGAFLRGVHRTNFSEIPFVGINTGSLGFFQEIEYNNLDDFLRNFRNSNYEVRKLFIMEAEGHGPGEKKKFQALNDFVVRSKDHTTAKIDVFIEDMLLENFSGDGLIVSTPAGSTAYNFSVGGSILYQELKGYQLSPIAPINTRAYRSLSNSIVLSSRETLTMVPSRNCDLIIDGFQVESSISEIDFNLSDRYINKLVFNEDTYWKNLKNKFLIE